MPKKDWRELISLYLTIDKKFDEVGDKFVKLVVEIEDHEKRLIRVEARLGSLKSQIGETCHQVFDNKIATWSGMTSKTPLKELPPGS